MNQDSRRKDYIQKVCLIALLALSIITTIIFLLIPNVLFIAHYHEEGKNTKRKETFQCHYYNMFFRYKKKFLKHTKHCSGRPDFIYSFKGEEIESYEN